MANSPIATGLQRSIRALHRLEDGLLALLLSAMVLLAPLQILLRDVFGGGIAWGDPLLRVLVLWVGLLGALSASREDRHITIDVVSRVLSERARTAVGALTSLVAAAVSGVISYHAARFVASELEFGSTAFSGVPAWTLESVLPFAFGAIALRYLLRFATNIRSLLVPESGTP